MEHRSERVRALEEAVKLLESVEVERSRLGELDFDDARINGFVSHALSAARAALNAASQRDDLATDRPPNP